PGVLSPADWAPAESVPASLAQPAIPACASGAATLSPGVYYDPAALSALTTTCASISLAPGVYWLDFPSAATPWNISKTLTGPAPATCDGTNGAQLIFG